jgi:hypothetical protein
LSAAGDAVALFAEPKPTSFTGANSLAANTWCDAKLAIAISSISGLTPSPIMPAYKTRKEHRKEIQVSVQRKELEVSV